MGKKEKLPTNTNIYSEEFKKRSMKIKKGKTKTSVIGTTDMIHNIRIDGRNLEQVKIYKYLGVILNNNTTNVKCSRYKERPKNK